MPQLNSEFFFSQIFWLFIAFALVYFFVSQYFFPRIGSVVELRNQKIEDDLVFSESVVTEYHGMRKEAAAILSAAKADAFSIVDRASKDAERLVGVEVAAIERDVSKQIATEEERLSRLQVSVQKEMPRVIKNLRDMVLDRVYLGNHHHDTDRS